MKFHLSNLALLLCTTLLTNTVTADILSTNLPSFPLGTHKFSRKAMEKWQESFSKNIDLKYHYHSSITLQKNLQPHLEWLKRCPLDLTKADIHLVHAEGSFRSVCEFGGGGGSSSTDEDENENVRLVNGDITVKSTKKLNNVRYDYYINNGDCGMITVKTVLDHTSDGKLNYYWSKPSYDKRRRQAIDNKDITGFSLDDVYISAGQALKWAQKDVKAIKKNRFSSITLKYRWLDGEMQPVYSFKGVKGVKNGEVHVSAKDATVYQGTNLG